MFDKVGLMDNTDVYSKMQVGEPYKRYKKTILGKVFVMCLDPFEGKPTGKVLVGNPRRNDEGCFFETWGPKDNAYFTRANKRHFDQKILVEVPVTPVERAKLTEDDMDDAQMVDLLNSRGFAKLAQTLNKMNQLDSVKRLLELSIQQEKSDKIVSAIQKRLSELSRE